MFGLSIPCNMKTKQRLNSTSPLDLISVNATFDLLHSQFLNQFPFP